MVGRILSILYIQECVHLRSMLGKVGHFSSKKYGSFTMATNHKMSILSKMSPIIMVTFRHCKETTSPNKTV
jgi:hypothetical protein